MLLSLQNLVLNADLSNTSLGVSGWGELVFLAFEALDISKLSTLESSS